MATVNVLAVRATFNDLTGTAYTLTLADNNKVVTLTNNSAITVTIPNNLPSGFECSLLQGGPGQVTVVPASGTTLNNRSGHNKLAGRYARASVLVVANASDAAAIVNFAGDTVA